MYQNKKLTYSEVSEIQLNERFAGMRDMYFNLSLIFSIITIVHKLGSLI